MSEYETIRVGQGDRRVIRVGTGETFQNKIIDCTAPDTKLTIAAHGTNWVIRNIGIKGRLSNDQAIFGVSDRSGGHSTIENVYIGDGAVTGHRKGLGIWVAPQHSGHIDIERTNIQEMGDNSFYCSAPMHSGAGGTVDIDHCYSRDSWVAHYRLGEGNVTNSVAVNTSAHKNGRGVWAWRPGPVNVDNCHFAMDGRHYSFVSGANGSGSTINVTNTEYDTGFNGGYRTPAGGNVNFGAGNGTDPRDFVPEGCPTSAEEAAGGEGGPVRHAYEHEISFEGEGRYFFATSGGDIEYHDSQMATGRVDDEFIAYGYDSFLSDVGFEGDVEVRINGEYEPTWSMYPTDDAPPRDYLDWDEDQPPDNDPDLDLEALEELANLIESRNEDMRELLNVKADTVDRAGETLDESDEHVGLLRRIINGVKK